MAIKNELLHADNFFSSFLRVYQCEGFTHILFSSFTDEQLEQLLPNKAVKKNTYLFFFISMGHLGYSADLN